MVYPYLIVQKHIRSFQYDPIFTTKKMHENELSFLIRKGIFNVYNNLGPGLLESVYCKALCDELRTEGLNFKSEVPLPYYYNNTSMQ